MTRRAARRGFHIPPPATIATLQGVAMFCTALWLTIQEAELPAVEVSWPRLVIYAGMMGGPFAARADTVRKATKALAGAEDPEGDP